MFLLLAVSELCVFLALWVWLETLLNRSLSGLSLSFYSPVALIFTPVGNLSFLGKLYQVQAKNVLILSGNSSGANERQLYLQANLITALKKLPVSGLSTTVATQYTFQRSPWWVTDYCRYHITWSTQTVLLHHRSYLSHSKSEIIILTLCLSY